MKTVIITIFLVGILMIMLFCYLRCNIGIDQLVKHEKFNKNKYLVLLFPGRDNNLTERAVLVSLAESENEMIGVFEENEEKMIYRSLFVVEPPQDYKKYVNNLNEEIKNWGDDTDWRNINYSFENINGDKRIRLSVTDRRGNIRVYSYSITKNSILPIGITTSVNTTKNLAN